METIIHSNRAVSSGLPPVWIIWRYTLKQGVLMRCTRLLFASAIPLCFCWPSFCQDIVSARSGVVHFLEGAVSLDDQPLDRKAGVFPTMKEGSTLRTAKGRAEILLTPNVFLRLDENSAVRMLSSSLTDTRLEFLQGSVILDSIDAPADPAIALTYKQTQIRFPKHGAFRLDSDTDVLRAYSGEAEVLPAGGKPVSIDGAHLYFFTLGQETNKFMDASDDEFYDWAKDRHETISSQNQLAQNALDSSQADADPNATAPRSSLRKLALVRKLSLLPKLSFLCRYRPESLDDRECLRPIPRGEWHPELPDFRVHSRWRILVVSPPRQNTLAGIEQHQIRMVGRQHNSAAASGADAGIPAQALHSHASRPHDHDETLGAHLRATGSRCRVLTALRPACTPSGTVSS